MTERAARVHGIGETLTRWFSRGGIWLTTLVAVRERISYFWSAGRSFTFSLGYGRTSLREIAQKIVVAARTAAELI